MKEKQIQNFYAEKLKGVTEVPTQYGFIDILTPKYIVEVKSLPKYKDAIGQLFTYGLEYPDKQPLLICFSNTPVMGSTKQAVVDACNRLSIELILHKISVSDVERYQVVPTKDALINSYQIAGVIGFKQLNKIFN